MTNTPPPSAAASELDALVDRFLQWPLPPDVAVDACALETGYPHRTGTNLLTANQARQMLEYVLLSRLSAGEGGPLIADLNRASSFLHQHADIGGAVGMHHAADTVDNARGELVRLHAHREHMSKLATPSEFAEHRIVELTARAEQAEAKLAEAEAEAKRAWNACAEAEIDLGDALAADPSRHDQPAGDAAMLAPSGNAALQPAGTAPASVDRKVRPNEPDADLYCPGCSQRIGYCVCAAPPAKGER